MPASTTRSRPSRTQPARARPAAKSCCSSGVSVTVAMAQARPAWLRLSIGAPAAPLSEATNVGRPCLRHTTE